MSVVSMSRRCAWLEAARALNGCSSTRAEVAARPPSSERRLIEGTSKMEDMETLLLTSCTTRFDELRMIGEGVHRENDRTAKTMPRKRHRLGKRYRTRGTSRWKKRK